MVFEISKHVMYNEKIEELLKRISSELGGNIEFYCKVVQADYSLRQIVEIVSKEFDIDKKEIFKRTRRRKYVDARRAVIYLAKYRIAITDKELGKFLKLDRSTVVTHKMIAQSLYDIDLPFKTHIDKCKSKMINERH